MTTLTEWANFYVILGSSAGALVGLQFVAITLAAGRRVPTMGDTVSSAFLTPSLVHFSCVLLMAAIATAPWPDTLMPAVLWGITGVGGIAYTAFIAHSMRVQTDYKPVMEDWIFRAGAPAVVYLLLAVTAVAVFMQAKTALFGIAATAVLLLFVGIHHAWDNVVYLVFVKGTPETFEEQKRLPD